MGELCKNSRTDLDAVWGLTPVGPGNHVLDGVQTPTVMVTFEGGHLPAIVTYLLLANVPTWGKWRTNTFTAVRGEIMAVLPLVRLLWTHAVMIVM